MMFKIESYWFDPMENRNADGWGTHSFCDNEREAQNFCNHPNHFWAVELSPWPLKYASHRSDGKVAMFRYSAIKSLCDTEEFKEMK